MTKNNILSDYLNVYTDKKVVTNISGESIIDEFAFATDQRVKLTLKKRN